MKRKNEPLRKKILNFPFLFSALLAFALFFIPLKTMAASDETTIDLNTSNNGASYTNWSCSGNTYTINGGVSVIGNVHNVNTNSRITLNIASNATVDWKATFESATSFNGTTTSALVIMFGNGTLLISDGYIHNQGKGSAIYARDAGAAIELSGGSVQSKTGSAIRMAGQNAIVTVSDGLVTNAGINTSSATIYMDYAYSGSNSLTNVFVTGNGNVYSDGATSDVAIHTNGDVEISGNAKVSASGGRAIHALGAGSKVMVSDNSQVWSDNGIAIHATNSGANVIVENGLVYSEAADGSARPAIHMQGGGSVTVKDAGKVEARTSGGYAIRYSSSNSARVSVQDNAQVLATTGRAIQVAVATVVVSGGRVSSTTGNAITSTTAGASITVSGGIVSATTGYAIGTTGSSQVNVSGGFVFAYGTGITGTNNVIQQNNNFSLSGMGVVVAWNRTGFGPWIYTEGESTALQMSPAGTATWHNDAARGGGINYINETNTGFFPLDVTVAANYGLIFNVADGNFYRDLDGNGIPDVSNLYDPGTAASWDNSTNTLALRGNFTWNTSVATALTIVGGNLTIKLEGNNTFESTSDTETSYGILFKADVTDVTITGSGSLTSTGSAATTSSYGIFASGNIMLSGGVVTTQGNTQAIGSSLFSVTGIASYIYWTGDDAESALQYFYPDPDPAFNNSSPAKYVKIQGNIFIWNGTAENNDWDTPENWNPTQVPGSSDIVVISGKADYYPVLSRNATVAEIHFEPGAQIKNQSLLTGKAFVQYDLSKRNRWLMLSMPLQEAYPGDFTFGGYPQTWVRKFEVSTGDGSITTGSWTTAYGSREAFSSGDGFVLWLNDDNASPATSDKGLKLLNSIREFPFFQHHTAGSTGRNWYQQIHQAHEYDGMQSTFYRVKLTNNDMEYERDNVTSYMVDRTVDAYRLAGASISKTLNFGINSETGGGDVALTGNPYMAVLDFNKLYEENVNVDDNTETIKPSYQVWTGSDGYGVYTINGYAGPVSSSGMDNYIAPLQAFIVEKSDRPSSDPLLFKESMTTVDNTANLRSSANKANKLDIIARNPVAGVLSFIAKHEGGQAEFGNLDARKIIAGISDVPEIYTLKPNKGSLVAVAVNIINDDNVLIPVGLATSYKGNVTFTFSGMDTYDAPLILIDTETKKEIDLTGLTSYDYVVDYTPKVKNGEPIVCEDRFFIRISKAPAGLQEIATQKVNVFAANGHIQIISSASNPIKEISVYDLQGGLLYKKTAVTSISHAINRNFPAGIYIVKVVSETNTDNVKLIIKK